MKTISEYHLNRSKKRSPFGLLFILLLLVCGYIFRILIPGLEKADLKEPVGAGILIGLVVLFCLSLLVRDLSCPISVLLNEDAVVFVNPYGRKFARLCYSEIRGINYKTGEDMIISYRSTGIITVSRDFDDLSLLHDELLLKLHRMRS